MFTCCVHKLFNLKMKRFPTRLKPSCKVHKQTNTYKCVSHIPSFIFLSLNKCKHACSCFLLIQIKLELYSVYVLTDRVYVCVRGKICKYTLIFIHMQNGLDLNLILNKNKMQIRKNFSKRFV